MICKLLNRDDSCVDKLTRPRPCSSPKSKPIIPKSQECLKGVLCPGGQQEEEVVETGPEHIRIQGLVPIDYESSCNFI